MSPIPVASKGMLTVYPSPLPSPASSAAPVPGKKSRPYLWIETYNTRSSS